MSRGVVIGAAIVLACARTAAAQTSGQPNLAEIARQAEAAKPSAPRAKKIYTNADLSAGGLAPAPAPAAADAGFVSSSLGKPVSAEEMLKLSNAKAAADQKRKEPDEYWIGQAAGIKRQVENLTARLEELKGRQKNPNATVQKKTEQDLAMAQQQLERFKKRWADLEEAGRTAKINMALLSPPPAFPQ